LTAFFGNAFFTGYASSTPLSVKIAGLTSCALQDGVQPSRIAARPMLPTHKVSGIQSLQIFIAVVPSVLDFEYPDRLPNGRFLAHHRLLANAGRLEI
jgi:hypothetical protein